MAMKARLDKEVAEAARAAKAEPPTARKKRRPSFLACRREMHMMDQARKNSNEGDDPTDDAAAAEAEEEPAAAEAEEEVKTPEDKPAQPKRKSGDGWGQVFSLFDEGGDGRVSMSCPIRLTPVAGGAG